MNEQERILNVLIFGQLMIDDMDELKDGNHLKGDIRDKAKAFIKQFRGKVSTIFKGLENPREVTDLYDINYALLRKINTLTIEQKKQIVDNWGNTKIHVIMENGVMKGYTTYEETAEYQKSIGKECVIIDLINPEEIC